MTKTSRADVTFRLKEYESGQPWILVEWLKGDDVFDGGKLGFDLKGGTSLAQANDVADYMRKHLTYLARTK